MSYYSLYVDIFSFTLCKRNVIKSTAASPERLIISDKTENNI